MNIEQSYDYSQPTGLGFSGQEYQYNGPNTVVALSNGGRTNPRVCPMRGLNGTIHVRRGRDDDSENGQARRRVAMACARCRKRKIRCSGDPGDGTGCDSCKTSATDPKTCLFHRVGDVFTIVDLPPSDSHSQAMVPLYNSPPTPIRSRTFTYPPSQSTKSVYPPWTFPYNTPYNSEEASPVETYGLDQPATYLPNQNPAPCGNNYRWSFDAKPPSSYIGHDSMIYNTHGLPYMQHNIRSAASSETLSHSMTSLQLTLPERPHTRSGLPVSHRRHCQLPPPQPSPAQNSRNVVDKLQDQRLRSARIASGSSFGNGVFVKPTLPYNHDSDIQVTAAAGILAAQVPTSAPVSTADNVTYYPTTTTSTAIDELPVSSGSQYNFNPLPLFDAPSPAPMQAAISNVRDSQDYKSFISPARGTAVPISPNRPSPGYYSADRSSGAKNVSSGNDSSLASGYQYTPLSQSQSQPQYKTDMNHANGLPKRTTGNGPIPTHRTPTTTAV